MAARAHWAGALADLVETMVSILTVAAARKTGRLPSFRVVSNETITAICTESPALEPEPTSLVFDRLFVARMLLVWDNHTHRNPEEASTYLYVDGREYVVGIAPRGLVDAIGTGDAAALCDALKVADRVISVPYGAV